VPALPDELEPAPVVGRLTGKPETTV
jgi:hypothetical protein